MKRTAYRAALLALLLGAGAQVLPSCKDPLGIEPQQSVDAATAYDSPTKIGSAVVGIYAKFDNPALYGTNLLLLPELMGGDGYVTWQGTFQSYREVARRTLTSVNTEAERTWRRAYEAVNQANLVLDNLGVVPAGDLRNQYEGEARFLRAAMFFELVRLYAPQYNAATATSDLGVPLPLTGNTTLEQADVKLPRATVAAVYAQVLNDLTAAASQLPDNNGTRAGKYAARALQARVYLQQRNYAAARAAADDVIQNSGRTLTATLASVFSNRNSTESLFEIQQNDQNNAGTSNDGLATFFASDGGVGRGDVQVSGNFASQYEGDDARGTDSLTAPTTKKLIYLGDGARPGRLRTLKWRTFGQNIPVLRLAEMYLIRAEADVRAGNAAAATADVNRIRQRSGASALPTVTLADVLRERQLELAFEGFRIHDLKRTSTDPTASVPITNPRLTLPIPQHDINVNPNLVQNPGY